MCNGSADTRKPEEKLADLIKRELGIEVNPQALRMLIRSQWARVSGYAHAIHGLPLDPTPTDTGGR